VEIGLSEETKVLMLMYVGDSEVVVESSSGIAESKVLENEPSSPVGLEYAGGDCIAVLL
jgi:hypothetical protein